MIARFASQKTVMYYPRRKKSLYITFNNLIYYYSKQSLFGMRVYALRACFKELPTHHAARVNTASSSTSRQLFSYRVTPVLRHID